MKKSAALLMIAAITLTCTACSISIDMNKINGEWTISTIGGQTAEEYAQANGLDITQVTINAAVSNENVVFTKYDSSVTCDIEAKSNGFEAKYNDNTIFTVVYDNSAETLSFDMIIDNNTVEYVFVKGTTSFESTPSDGSEDLTDEEQVENENAEE